MTTRAELVAELAPQAPPCYDSRRDWISYLQTTVQSRGPSVKRIGVIDARTSPPKFNKDFNFCRECLASHALKMISQGRCNPRALKEQPHPELR
jgi:hypothetical protein